MTQVEVVAPVHELAMTVGRAVERSRPGPVAVAVANAIMEVGS